MAHRAMLRDYRPGAGCAHPHDPDALIRMNFVRNAHEEKETRISAWFSSLRAHADPLSRGWILFE